MTPVGHIASSLILAIMAPWAAAFIGLPVSLMLSPNSTTVGVFASLLFSPIVTAPISILIGFPILIGLSKFWRLGFVQCMLAGAGCSIPGMYIMAALLARVLPRGLSLGHDELRLYLLAGAAFGGLFWAAYRLTSSRRVELG